MAHADPDSTASTKPYCSLLTVPDVDIHYYTCGPESPTTVTPLLTTYIDESDALPWSTVYSSLFASTYPSSSFQAPGPSNTSDPLLSYIDAISRENGRAVTSIVGGVVGGLAFLVALVVGIFALHIWRRRRERYSLAASGAAFPQTPDAKTSYTVNERPLGDSPSPDHDVIESEGDAQMLPPGDESSDLSSPIGSIPGRRSFWQALGLYAVYVLLAGTLAMVGAMAFIAFLWAGGNATPPWIEGISALAWRKIMIAGWATRAVTLSSLVLRLAVATQAGLCTSMLAAVALERFVVPMATVAEVSTIRNSNAGPHHLMWALAQGLPRIRDFAIMTPLLTLLVTSILSQLTSTALLFDLGPGMVLGDTQPSFVTYGKDILKQSAHDLVDAAFSKGVSYMRTQPPDYPTFAEYSEPALEAPGVGDTGLTLRALVPFRSASERSTLRSYSGMTTLLDARVTCVTPVIALTNVSWVNGISFPDELWVRGKVEPGHIPPMLRRTRRNHTGAFSCEVPIASNSSYQRANLEWKTSLCKINQTEQPLLPAAWDGSVGYSNAFLLFNSTGSEDEWKTILDRPAGWRYSPGRSDSWLDMVSPTEHVKMSATMCFVNFQANEFHVRFDDHSNRTEPSLGWDPATDNYHSVEVRRQLGATPARLPLHERGVMTLEAKDWAKEFPGPITFPFSRVTALNDLYNVNLSAIMCTYCGVDPDVSVDVHPAHVALFQDILTSTGSAALALQAFYTTLIQMAYHSSLPQFDLAALAEYAFSVPVVMPRSWKGFIAVTTVLFVHLGSLVFVCVLFFARTNFSMLGNAWQTVAQASVGDLGPTLAKSTMASDDQVQRWLAARKQDQMALGVAVSRDAQRVVITRRKPS